ncbi:MAG: cupin [Actinomycetia bacterium]|nr:cupin [Actinomycetes bacterium]
MATSDIDPTLDNLYADMAAADVAPLWTQRENLMPVTPLPAALPHVWRWKVVHALAERAGVSVPVGRGGERRAIALANPGLGNVPFATPTLWAAIQYLGAHETAPAHRHSQTAFRFVLHGGGVWTVVNGDPVEMRRGDLLLTPAWAWHEHHNTSDDAMTWLDGLDIPLVSQLDAGFFEYGRAEISDRSTPSVARSEQLWQYAGLRPIGGDAGGACSPLMVYRWESTDAALRAQLDLDNRGEGGVVSRGHAAVRFTNPATGSEVLPTIRIEMHRIRAGQKSVSRRAVGSDVWQVFDGSGVITLDGLPVPVGEGDLVAVPSWCAFQISADTTLDLFRFSDAPVYEKLGLARTDFEPEDKPR